LSCAQRGERDIRSVRQGRLRDGRSFWDRAGDRHCLGWRGQPLTSREVVVNLIGATTTRTGLSVHAELDERSYPAGIKVTDAEMAVIRPRLEPHDFHGDWNYTLRPPRRKMTPV
jgi:hypothetical protein